MKVTILVCFLVLKNQFNIVKSYHLHPTLSRNTIKPELKERHLMTQKGKSMMKHFLVDVLNTYLCR